jgi:hypothetical protein
VDPNEYAKTWNAINTNGAEGNTDVSQTEMLDYFAKNHITDQEEMLELWGGYLTKFDPDTNMVPYYEGGVIKTRKATAADKKLINKILERNSTEEIPTVEEAAQPTPTPTPSPTPAQAATNQPMTMDDAISYVSSSLPNIYDPEAAWKKASKTGITPQGFVNTYADIDANGDGRFTKDEFRKYLNNKGYDDKTAATIIKAFYPSNWGKLKYNNGTWN